MPVDSPNFQYTPGSSYSTNDRGTVALGVDSTGNNYQPLQLDASGKLLVNLTGSTSVLVSSTAVRITNTSTQRVPVIPPSSFIPPSTVLANQGAPGSSTAPWPVTLPSSFVPATPPSTVTVANPTTAVRVTNTTAQRVPVLLPSSFVPPTPPSTVTVANPTTAVRVTNTTRNVTQGTSPWVVSGTVTASLSAGTLANGAETTVGSTAVQILAASTARKKLMVQNTGAANIRVGVSGVTNVTGLRLVPNGSVLLEMPNCPTQAIFAIREGLISSVAFAQQVT